MSIDQPKPELGKRAKQLRNEQKWSQNLVAKRLGITQSRLSRIESGLSAVSGQELIGFLRLFNVGVSAFVDDTTELQSLQNALARFGANHFRVAPNVLTYQEHSTPAQLIVAVLLNPQSYRHVTALAPVLIRQIDEVVLPVVQHQLAGAGLPHRLGWLVQNVIEAVPAVPIDGLDRAWNKAFRRTLVVCDAFLRLNHPRLNPDGVPLVDVFDPGIRSRKNADSVREQLSGASLKWGILTKVQTADFITAVQQAVRS